MSPSTGRASRSCSTGPGSPGPDGPSHHGMWDLAILQVVPGIRIAAPRDATRLREELGEAVAVEDAPTVMRFPKGSVGTEFDGRAAHRRRRRRAARGAAPRRADRDRRPDGEARPAGRRAARGPGDRRDGRRPALGRAGAARASSSIAARLPPRRHDRGRHPRRRDRHAHPAGPARGRRRHGRRRARAAGRVPRARRAATRSSRDVGLTDQQIARDIVAQVLGTEGTRIPVARPLPDEKPAPERSRAASKGSPRREIC